MGIVEDLRWTAAKLINVTRFATLTDSLKGGVQVYSVVKGKLKGQTPANRSNEHKRQNFVALEEIQARLEKLQEGGNSIQQQSEIPTTDRTQGQEHLDQFPDEPLKSSALEVPQQRKIFIRSRL